MIRKVRHKFPISTNQKIHDIQSVQVIRSAGLTHLSPRFQHVLSERLTSLGQHMLELICENATVGTNGLIQVHAIDYINTWVLFFEYLCIYLCWWNAHWAGNQRVRIVPDFDDFLAWIWYTRYTKCIDYVSVYEEFLKIYNTITLSNFCMLKQNLNYPEIFIDL